MEDFFLHHLQARLQTLVNLIECEILLLKKSDSVSQSNFDGFFGHAISMFTLDLFPTHDPIQSQNFSTLSLKVQLVRLLVPQLGLIISNITLTFPFLDHFQFLEIPFVSFTSQSKFIVKLN